MKAANGGLDVEMGSDGFVDSFFMAQPLIEAVKSGFVDVKYVDEKVRRILRVMFSLRITTNNR